MWQECEAQRGALATGCRFNATLSANYVWFWPKIAAALTSKHLDLDLRVKPRDPEASIRVGLREV
jgi:hypothetical protein